MKYLLLAKSNIKKTKGLTIGLILLITLAACFLNVFLLINLDYNNNASKVAESLNTEDGYILVSGNIDGINEHYFENYNEIEDIEIIEELAVITDLPFNEGTIGAYVAINDESLFDVKIGKYEVLLENDLKENYIYLPYQFKTGGGYDLDDDFEFKILNNDYKFKIKGFINTITFGSNNVGAYQLILSDDAYQTVKNDSNNMLNSKIVKFKLKDDVNANKFLNKVNNQIISDNKNVQTTIMSLNDAIFGRTFLGVIFGAILLIVFAIVLIIVILMLSNNISNFIRENIKMLGALKAIGYTTKDLTISFISEFVIIDLIGSVIGIVLSKYVMQMIGDMMVTQSAIPYTAKFIPITILITTIALLIIVMVSLLFVLRKTKKIEPIVALREGTIDKVKKSNILPLSKSNMPLNINLSIKTTFNNMKQNIITMIITFFLIIMSTLSLTLYQNFAVNPKYSLMTFELCDGTITVDGDEDKEVFNYLNNLDKVENLRLVSNGNVNIDDAKLYTYIIDDYKKLKNQEVVYDGAFPQKDDEIAISGKFASLYDIKINDVVEIKSGDNSLNVKVTGFIQTLNNSGMEAILPESVNDKLVGKNYNKIYFFESENIDEVFDIANEEFGDKILSTMDYMELAKGALSSFEVIAFALVLLVFIINMLIMLLVLYMLIKTLVNRKLKDYGILKALGYTSRQIIFQNALSFMPTIVISVIISSVVSYLYINNLITLIMNMFGIMKLTFDIPAMLITLMGIVFIIVSFIIALLLSRKIKKIEPYKLLTGE